VIAALLAMALGGAVPFRAESPASSVIFPVAVPIRKSSRLNSIKDVSIRDRAKYDYTERAGKKFGNCIFRKVVFVVVAIEKKFLIWIDRCVAISYRYHHFSQVGFRSFIENTNKSLVNYVRRRCLTDVLYGNRSDDFLMGAYCQTAWRCGEICSQFSFGRILGDFVGLSGGFPSLEIEPQRYGETDRPEEGDPETPLCPKCAIFGGLSRAPLGAKIGFVVPFWVMAWLSFFKGLDMFSDRRNGSLFVVGSIAIAGIPLFIGIF